MTGRVGFPETLTHSHNSGCAVVLTVFNNTPSPALPPELFSKEASVLANWSFDNLSWVGWVVFIG